MSLDSHKLESADQGTASSEVLVLELPDIEAVKRQVEGLLNGIEIPRADHPARTASIAKNTEKPLSDIGTRTDEKAA